MIIFPTDNVFTNMIINITWVHKEEHNFTVIQQYQVFLVDLESYSIGNFGLSQMDNAIVLSINRLQFKNVEPMLNKTPDK